MVDIELLVNALRAHGHLVEHVEKLPENAGEFQFRIDGVNLSLAETRVLLEQDQLNNTKTDVAEITRART